MDRNNYRAVLNWVRTLTPDYSDKLFFELKTEPSSDQLGSTQVYHVGSSIDSVKMTDLLSKLIPVFQQKTVTGAPASANAVNPIQLFGFNSSSSMDLNEIDRSALDKMPYGLYLADSVRIVPIIKISDSAVLDDAFFKNQSVRYVDLTL